MQGEEKTGVARSGSVTENVLREARDAPAVLWGVIIATVIPRIRSADTITCALFLQNNETPVFIVSIGRQIPCQHEILPSIAPCSPSSCPFLLIVEVNTQNNCVWLQYSRYIFAKPHGSIPRREKLRQKSSEQPALWPGISASVASAIFFAAKSLQMYAEDLNQPA
jgi:hypothetical protein